MTARMWPLAVILTLTTSVAAQQRDTTNKPSVALAGAGEIGGVVLSPDGQPVRRAVVTLTGDVPVPRTVLSDDAGTFTFASLPAGTFQVSARKASYLAAPYGAMRPGRAGTSIALTAGQKADIRITMFKGASITGMLRDSAGLPLPGIDVRVIDVRTLTTLDTSPIEIATTDDRGVFRIYSLLPGEYVVVALPGIAGSEIGAPSAMDMDATLAALAARTRSAGTAAPPALPSTARAIGFAPVFFPGTPFYIDAARVRVGPGEERTGIDFEMKPVPVASVDATVSGPVPNLAAVQVTLIPTGPRFNTSFSSASLAGKPIDAEGRFKYSNLSPGRYRLVARARRGDADPASGPTIVNGAAVQGGGRGGGAPAAGPPPAFNGDYLYGFADVDLRGEDVKGVSLSLQIGAVITGRIVLNGSGAGVNPEDLTKTRVSVSAEGGGWNVSSDGLAMGPGITTQAISSVKADGTFEIRGIGPGRFTLGSTLPADAKGWSLRSVAVRDRDLLDEPFDLVPGMEIRDVTLTYSDTPAELSGTLTSASGQPTKDYYIVLLPSDRTLWRQKSRRIVSTRPSTTGQFRFTNVPTGSYVVTALTDLDPLDLLDLSFLEQIAPAGVGVTVREGEKKVQDLRIR